MGLFIFSKYYHIFICDSYRNSLSVCNYNGIIGGTYSYYLRDFGIFDEVVLVFLVVVVLGLLICTNFNIKILLYCLNTIK